MKRERQLLIISELTGMETWSTAGNDWDMVAFSGDGFSGESVMSITSTGGGDSLGREDGGPTGLVELAVLGEEPGKWTITVSPPPPDTSLNPGSLLTPSTSFLPWLEISMTLSVFET